MRPVFLSVIRFKIHRFCGVEFAIDIQVIILDAVARAGELSDLEEIRRELTETGFLKSHAVTNPKKKKGCVEYFCENCGQTITVLKSYKWLKRIAAIVFCFIVLTITAMIALPNLLSVYHYSMAKYHIKQKNYTTAYYHLQNCNGYNYNLHFYNPFACLVS